MLRVLPHLLGGESNRMPSRRIAHLIEQRAANQRQLLHPDAKLPDQPQVGSHRED